MVDTKQVLFTAVVTAAVAFAGSAMAGSKKSEAPGQTGDNPGQTFKSERALDPDALSPGQQFKLNRETDPDAPAPGQGVDNWGKTKQPQ
jgi:hypothetical protein